MKSIKLLNSIIGIFALLACLTAAPSEALIYSSTQPISPAMTLNTGDYTELSFAVNPAYLTNANLKLNVTGLTNAVNSLGISPPRGELFDYTTGNYLFSSDFQSGPNTLNLDGVLSELKSAGSSAGIDLLLWMDRGSITIDSATLSGTSAAAPVPEPASVTLLAIGIVIGLLYIRKTRNNALI